MEETSLTKKINAARAESDRLTDILCNRVFGLDELPVAIKTLKAVFNECRRLESEREKIKREEREARRAEKLKEKRRKLK